MGLIVRVWEESADDLPFRAVLTVSGRTHDEHLAAASLDELCQLLLARLDRLEIGGPIRMDPGHPI